MTTIGCRSIFFVCDKNRWLKFVDGTSDNQSSSLIHSLLEMLSTRRKKRKHFHVEKWNQESHDSFTYCGLVKGKVCEMFELLPLRSSWKERRRNDSRVKRSSNERRAANKAQQTKSNGQRAANEH